MNRKQKAVLGVGLAALILLVAGIIGTKPFGTLRPGEPTTLAGSVLLQNPDPTKQSPVAGVTVTAAAGETMVTTKSDPSGFFSLTLTRGVKKGEAVTLTFTSSTYKTVEITTTSPGDQLYIARMQALRIEPSDNLRGGPSPNKTINIKNVRVRYSFKDESMVSVGSFAKQFLVPNKGNVPCHGESPCSTDGRWKATKTTLSLDADEGNQFSNVRVSCMAGPCAFTKTEPLPAGQPQRKITVSVLNWSDDADFLVEADVSRTMVTDAVRVSYPFILGQTISFSLPPSSEGPSVEADVDGRYIVFPLGPTLKTSWGSCSVEVSENRDKMYRCLVKPAYRIVG